jgi:hypothetical protein
MSNLLSGIRTADEIRGILPNISQAANSQSSFILNTLTTRRAELNTIKS